MSKRDEIPLLERRCHQCNGPIYISFEGVTWCRECWKEHKQHESPGSSAP